MIGRGDRVVRKAVPAALLASKGGLLGTSRKTYRLEPRIFCCGKNEKKKWGRFIKPDSLHHFAGTAYRAPETLLKQSYGTVNGYVRVLCEPQY